MRLPIIAILIAISLAACNGIGDRGGRAAVDLMTPEQRAEAVRVCAVLAAAGPLAGERLPEQYRAELMAACAQVAADR